MTTPFPRSATFMTIDEPFRFEGRIFDLEVDTCIPAWHLLPRRHGDGLPVSRR